MKAECISTGAELLNGRTLNRHAQALGGLLNGYGLTLDADTTITDDIELICDTLRCAMGRSDLIFVTGGLGPTSDDVTRDAVAKVLGRDLYLHPETLERAREQYRQNGRTLTPQGERQALVVEGCTVLNNSAGLAAGELIHVDGKNIFILPGPPRELNAILKDHLTPWLEKNFPDARGKDVRMFMLTGIGESDLVAQLDSAGFSEDGLEVSYRAAPGRVELCLTSTGEQETLTNAEALINRELNEFIYARERITLDTAVSNLLSQSGKTISVAESCTGGMLGDRLTHAPGSSAWFMGGFIAYSNTLKTSLLDVPEDLLNTVGAVSEDVAKAMAEGVRQKTGSDLAIGITGIAGPDGGTNEKPVGLVYIALASNDRTDVVKNTFSGDRAMVKNRSCLKAMDMIRHVLS